MGVEIREKAPSSMKPTPEMWNIAKRWTPAGAVAGLLLLFIGLGGREGIVALAKGISEAVAESSANRAEVIKLSTSIESLSANVALLSKKLDERSARDEVQDYNTALICDWVSAMNQGKPEKTWCATSDGRSVQFYSPPAGQLTPNLVTDTPWKKAANE